MIFANITDLVLGLIALAAGIGLILRARRAVSATMLALLALGLVALAVAMGEPTIRWPAKETVRVMVDLSPSTRGAAYRDAKWRDVRLKTLLGNIPHTTTEFESDNSRETHFAPAAGTPVVLFSDGQFDLPKSAPATYIVVDPNLEHVDDAAIASLRIVDDRAVAEVVNHGPARSIRFNGAAAMTVPSGESVQSTTIPSGAVVMTVRVEGQDRWPENDALSIRVPSPPHAVRWWIGESPPNDAWTRFAAAQLPNDANAYLDAGMIVLSNVPADALSLDQQRRLSQYVRDLGGTLVILGGEHAFSAGGYARTMLDDLSPLASTPPSPTTHWIVLVDSSGSMATPIGATTRFRAASDAAAQLLLHLPQSDLVSVGGFARGLRWWINGEQVSRVHQSIPPPDATANGPTNLQAALETIATSADRSLPNELLIISDTDAAISDAATLASNLTNARVRVSVLSIGGAGPNNALEQIASLTKGRFIQQPDAVKWPAMMRDLARSASPEYLLRGTMNVTFSGALSFLPPRSANLLNRAWLKNGATGAGQTRIKGETIPAAGEWQVGSGRVIAIATGISASDANAVADRFGQLPSDPRLKVSWDAGSSVNVRVDAQEPNRFLNDLKPTLELISPASGAIDSHTIPQTGPGEYQLSLPTPNESMLATIRNDGRILSRFAVAGHYPREFYPLGNDRAAMRKLAEMSGGEVIEPNDNRAIDFHWPPHKVSLAPWLALIGMLSIAGALGAWRRA